MIGRSFAFTLCLVLAACASPATRLGCQQRDWYEIGRRDGAQGAAEGRLDTYRAECRANLTDHDESIYVNGRHAGLVEYCQPESGYQLGRAGQPYHHVCPPTVEGEFLASYQRGRRAREIEQRRRELDAQIEGVSNRLLRAGDPRLQRSLGGQLDLLKQARVRADRELDKVSR